LASCVVLLWIHHLSHRDFPFVSLQLPLPIASKFIDPSLLAERERVIQLRSIHCIRSDARRILVVASFLLASPNALEPSLSFFSPRIFQVQTIIMFYIVTTCWRGSAHASHGSRCIVRPFASPSSTATLSSSSGSRSTVTLSAAAPVVRRRRSPVAVPFV
jgi:hypothetical protein